MNELLRAARDRAHVLALVAIVASVFVLPERVPGGIFGVGIVSGAALALQALGVVLVYRANRIVNFAQVQIGVVAAVLFRLLVEQRAFLRALRAICEPCLDRESSLAVNVNYWISLAVSLGVALLVSFLIYRFVVRRFADAPRLVLTVATVGIAQLLASIQAALPGLLATQEQKDLSQVPQGIAAVPPLDFSVRWDPARFGAADILTVAVAAAVLGALFAFLRSSRRGIAIRAAAENRERASTLGIDVDSTTSGVWLMAGGLSAVAGLLLAMSAPAAPAESVNIALMVRILAAAIVATMTSLPLTVLAAFALGIFDQAMLWVFESTAITDGLLAGVVAVVLLLQRARTSRVEQELAAAWRAAREVRPIPKELRPLPEVRRWLRIGAVALAVGLVGAPFVLSPLQTSVLTTTSIFAMVGISLLVLSGWAGQISLGQFALAGIGAYVGALAAAEAGFPMPLALAAGGCAGTVAAAVVGLPAIRMRGLHLAISTLAVALTTSSILLSPTYLGAHIPEAVERPSIVGIDLDDGRTFYYVTLVVLALVVAATLGLRRSRIGRILIASRDNEAAAQSFGANLTRVRLGAFAISGFLAGVAGTMFVYQQEALRPASFTPDVSVTMFLMAVIGGLGSIAGPLLGALFLGILQLFSVSPLVLFLATGGGVVFLLLVLPGGLAQLAADVRDAALRRLARRRGIVVPSLLADVRTDGRGRARAPIAAKLGPGGSTAFVPARYRLEEITGVRSGTPHG